MHSLLLVLKGMAMGAANVIPGVSGGTIAFITGVYERLIAALRNIDVQAVKLFFTGKWKSVAEHIDFAFLFWLFLGVGISILSLAKVLEWAFEVHESLTLAFFFGLIIASILGVGRQIEKFNGTVILALVVGCAIAVAIAFLPPATENTSILYIILCGAVAVCSMILPGLSGSYILLLMGNYLLVLSAISTFNFGILGPLMIGVVLGLILFSRLLHWLFENYKDATIALLTGFVAGSLLIIWPWKNATYILVNEEQKATGYEWIAPTKDSNLAIALALMIVGFLTVWIMDRASSKA